MIELSSDKEFDEKVKQATIPLLVDFWAPWCAPCKEINKVIHEVERKYNGRLACAKINIEEHPKVASSFKIRSIPSLIVFLNGTPTKQLVGSVSKSQIEEVIDFVLAKKQ